MRILPLMILMLILLSGTRGSAQQTGGLIAGNVLDEKSKAIEAATVMMINMDDSTQAINTFTDHSGQFILNPATPGYYRLRITHTGLQPLQIDSIWLRAGRMDFQLSDLVLRPAQSTNLGAVVIYSEKPLIQSSDGNITFNAGESALSAGSNASDLLTMVPLVAKDADGKITVRGREPKILIDDKPVELNMQQLQDLLESLPGSAIEKIEVMTNPPPQYANEQGGVINITMRKGRVGKTGRVSVTAGTRHEASLNGSFNYRHNGLSININAGAGLSSLGGEGSSLRNNLFADSSNSYRTSNHSLNKSRRPNFRFNMDYNLDKFQSLNAVIQFNANDYDNFNTTTYTNYNEAGEIWRLSERSTTSEGDNYNGSFSLSYLLKSKRPGEQLRIIGTTNYSNTQNDRNFFEQFFTSDHQPNGLDSTQRQFNTNNGNSYNVRVNYDRPFIKTGTTLSAGGYLNRNNSLVDADAFYLRKSDGSYLPLDLLTNRFRFHQTVANYRASLKQLIGKDRAGKQMSLTAGLSVEQTFIWFELIKEGRDVRNNYVTPLPFVTFNKRWANDLNLSSSWRRSTRRPGINELNPTIDLSDPYNIRFGNEKLDASTADNFDIVFGRTKPDNSINLGLGFNDVKDIFNRVRTLLPDGRTQITWQNISGRHEYEISTWGGITVNRKWRSNVSASYTRNVYSAFDRAVNQFRNGGSFTSNLSATYTLNDIQNFMSSFNFNRFATPQGYARWNWSMNLGIQRKFLQKKMVVTLNMVDPFSQQRNRNVDYGPDFTAESYSKSNTRNFRITIGYNLSATPKKLVLPGAKG